MPLSEPSACIQCNHCHQELSYCLLLLSCCALKPILLQIPRHWHLPTPHHPQTRVLASTAALVAVWTAGATAHQAGQATNVMCLHQYHQQSLFPLPLPLLPLQHLSLSLLQWPLSQCCQHHHQCQHLQLHRQLKYHRHRSFRLHQQMWLPLLLHRYHWMCLSRQLCWINHQHQSVNQQCQ